jgi:hypothetical protein
VTGVYQSALFPTSLSIAEITTKHSDKSRSWQVLTCSLENNVKVKTRERNKVDRRRLAFCFWHAPIRRLGEDRVTAKNSD